MRRTESAEYTRVRDGEITRLTRVDIEQSEMVPHSVAVRDPDDRVTPNGVYINRFRERRFRKHPAHERVPAALNVDL